MKIIPHPQQSVEWMVARAGIPTASEFDQLLTPKLEPRDGQMPETYLARKLAERWTGGPIASLNTFDMEQGQILEERAIPWYELEFSETIQRVGLVTTDDGKIGCSPDGLIGEDGGVEIKCPKIETHVRYLLSSEVPKDYTAQVHGTLYVTGRPWWKFVSFHRRLPALALVKLVERDESVIARIDETLQLFNARLDRAFQRLCEMNGGPPVRSTIQTKLSTEITDIYA